MSRTGDCWDNAVAESFFGTIKGELVDHERYPTRDAARASIGDYIEGSTTPLEGIRTSVTKARSSSN